MSKHRFIIIIVVLSAMLVLAVVAFRNRLFPGDGEIQTGVASKTSSQLITDAPAGINPLVRIHQELKAKNPNYNGRGQFRMTNGKITIADVSRTGITDPSPLKELPLKALDISENPISDIASLSGMQLNQLALEATKITDILPLQRMKLTGLYLNRTRVKNLGPLQGMPLELLNLYETDVQDLSPLRGMPLKFLWLNGTKVTDISPVAQCPLISLTLHKTPVSDLSPLADSKTLRRIHIAESDVTDLTPLKAMELERLIFTPAKITKGMDIARNMKSIREIGVTLKGKMSPGQFWALYDQGQFR